MREISLLAICALIFSSCTIVPKYHSTGFTISRNSKIYVGSKTHSIANGKKPIQNSKKNSDFSVSMTSNFFPAKSASQHPKSASTNKTFTYLGLRQSLNPPMVDFVVAPFQNSRFTTTSPIISNTYISAAGSYPLDSAKAPKPKKTLEELEKQLFYTEDRIRENFGGFALLLSPLIINASGKESKFVTGWNITFITLSLLCFFFAIFYCIKYVFQWSRYTILRHTRK